MEKLTNCENCKNLGKNTAIDCPFYYCKITKGVVPQETNRVNGEYETSFHRIPTSCPLPESEVKITSYADYIASSKL